MGARAGDVRPNIELASGRAPRPGARLAQIGDIERDPVPDRQQIALDRAQSTDCVPAGHQAANVVADRCWIGTPLGAPETG
jgi:hypothetical protein